MADIATGDRRWLWPLALFAVLFAVSFIVRDAFFNHLLKLSALNVIVVAGLNLLMGYAGQAFIAVAATFAIGAYTSALAMLKLGLPFVLAWLGGALIAGVFGVVSGTPAFRLAGAYLAMVSIAFNVVVEEVLIHWSDVTGGPIGISGVPPVRFGAWALDDREMAALAIATAAASWLIVEVFRRSPWGLAMTAMRESELAIRSLGADTVALKAAAFFVSACLIGLGGGLYAHSIKYISPDVGSIFSSIMFVLMLILGGMRTGWGPILGASLLTVVPYLLSDFQRYHLIVLGAILLVLVVTMPEGVVSLMRSRRAGAMPAQAAVKPSASFVPAWRSRGGPLTVKDLTRSFGGIAALRGVSLTVAPGEVHGLIGPNGSGKSTFVNVVTGVYAAERGSVNFAGRDLTGARMPERARAGLVRTFQTPQLFRTMTVRENLAAARFARHAPSLVAAMLWLRSSRRAAAEAAASAEYAAARLGLTPHLDRLAGALPQAEQRKVEIARALATEPGLIILDEPAAGLSTEEGEDLCTLLAALRSEGIGVLLIEHHMDVIMRVCDRITVLDRGGVIAEGRPNDIQQDAQVRLAYLGTKSAAPDLRLVSPRKDQ